VCWNYLYLSRLLAEEKDEERRTALLEAVRNGSAATWAHFNLHGEFDFSDERMVDSMNLGYGNDSVQNGPFAECNGSGRRIAEGSWAMGSLHEPGHLQSEPPRNFSHRR
jgi:hypothetical protein